MSEVHASGELGVNYSAACHSLSSCSYLRVCVFYVCRCVSSVPSSIESIRWDSASQKGIDSDNQPTNKYEGNRRTKGPGGTQTSRQPGERETREEGTADGDTE